MPLDDLPPIGFGTWQNTGPGCADSVQAALETGYRHVDTAQIYRNEEQVGRGIERADVDREDLLLATKVWTDNLGHESVLRSTEESLEKLGTDYVDILYVHWPAGAYDPEETLSAFDRLAEEGKTREIAVSNFPPERIEEAREVADHRIFANQVEMHPFLQQEEIHSYCVKNDLYLVAYSPLARGDVIGHPVLQEIAENHDASEPQVAIAWLVSKENVVPIPKATPREHIEDNYAALDLELTYDEVERIDGITETKREVDPGFAPW